MFHPWNVGLNKVRIGSKQGDGGYIIIDSSFGSKYILGYGVDKDLSFENELTERYGMKGFVFDHTIEEIPNISSNVMYFREGIGGFDAAPIFTLETHVKRFIPEGESFILKMDVEGCEWDVLRTADLSRVTQLIIELHEMQEFPKEIIEKLNENFYLAHIHGNNCHNQPWVQIDRFRKMPRYLECTYVRKDLVPGVMVDSGNFPIPQDVKCRPDVPELELNFWKRCDVPISFVAKDRAQVLVLNQFITEGDEIISQKENAKNKSIFILEPDEIVPVGIILSLKDVKDSVEFPILKNGYCESYEIRFINGPQVVRCNETILRFKKSLMK